MVRRGGMRYRYWKVLGTALGIAWVSLGCAAPKRVPALEKLRQVEVEGASPLIIQVTDMEKRPLRAEELSPPTRGGFLWEYRVRIVNSSEMGVTLEHLHLTVQNLWGGNWPGDHPLNLKVKGWSEGQVLAQAQLASTDPQDTAGLTGIEVLTFLGRRDDGKPISFTVRVPLD
jgi:hypothetical protein